MPNVKLNPSAAKTGKVIALVGIFMMLAATTAIAAPQMPSLKGPNLFSLIGSLNGTTTNILNSSKALSSQVARVQTQLAQLNQQQLILGQQMETGQALDSQLATQIDLTNQDVGLMRDILTREQRTATAASSVADASDKLSRGLNENIVTLSNLVHALHVSSQESRDLSGQLDQLSSELKSSKAEFRLFGQVNSLLNQLLGKSSGSGLLPSLNPSSLLNSGPLSLLPGQSNPSGQSGHSSKSKGTGSDSLLGGLVGGDTSQLPVLGQLP